MRTTLMLLSLALSATLIGCGTSGPGKGNGAKDSDGDGLTDTQEATFGTDSGAADTDADGLTDKEEFDLGTSGTEKITLPTVNAPTSQLQWTVYFPQDAKISKHSFEGSIRHVEWYSTSPQLPPNATVTESDRRAVQRAAEGMAGTMGQGVEPVDVQLPLAGQALYFEKMLALDEELWASFDYTLKEK